MLRDTYGQKESAFGWNIDHIFPKSKGGPNCTANMMWCHFFTNSEKGADYPEFCANNKIFKIECVHHRFIIKEIANKYSKQIHTRSGRITINFKSFPLSKGRRNRIIVQHFGERQIEYENNSIIYLLFEQTKDELIEWYNQTNSLNVFLARYYFKHPLLPKYLMQFELYSIWSK